MGPLGWMKGGPLHAGIGPAAAHGKYRPTGTFAATFVAQIPLRRLYNLRATCLREGRARVAEFRLREPIAAIFDKPAGEPASVMIPEGALLDPSSKPSATLFGMMGIWWEGRHYSVYPQDLLQKAERISKP